MRIVVTANQAPFIEGGAESHARHLVAALREHGHQVELLRFYFRFHPPAAIESLMRYCEQQDLALPNGQSVDRVISLQFPGYGVQHPDQIVWLLHQHRAAYELYDPDTATPAERRLRDKIHAYDNRVLGRARARFANSARVAERLATWNGLTATPLHHPPPAVERLEAAESWGYIFCPSRLETLKRQWLLIEAAAKTQADTPILIAGDGGQRPQLEQLIAEHGLGHRVRLLGRVSEAQKRRLYAHARAVFFGPHDEDYGYITLEAMAAAKPVVTCTDSGGVLGFVEPGVTGMVAAPQPAAVAQALDEYAADPARAAREGAAGRAAFDALELNWNRVVETLLAA
jgi:glycosyltransferase involved in cell wall biosynthesis